MILSGVSHHAIPLWEKCDDGLIAVFSTPGAFIARQLKTSLRLERI